MPFISEAASAIKSRFGFHNPSESARATPDISSRSSFRENLSQFSAIRSFNDRDGSKDANISKESEMVVRSFELIEEPSFWKDNNVQVIIRLRPLSSSEISNQGYSRCVRQESHQTVTWTGHPETRFTFDLVADETVSQEMLFSVAGVPMVEYCVNGYNSCMFAYGQTGSGKTHTMLGDIKGGTCRHSVSCGMTPRVFEHLFSRIQKEKETRSEEKMRFTCKCSFLEIYNEHIVDLLNPSSSNLHIREDPKKGVYVENLTEIEVSTACDVMQQLQEELEEQMCAYDGIQNEHTWILTDFQASIQQILNCSDAVERPQAAQPEHQQPPHQPPVHGRLICLHFPRFGGIEPKSWLIQDEQFFTLGDNLT